MREFRGFQKGINLGGWISQFDRYDPEHFRTFITKEDIDTIAALGFDHVRVPVDYIVLEDEEGNRKEEGFGYLERCREWCAQDGLHMLIDLHECYGYSFDPLKHDDKRRFFFDRDLQERFLNLWEDIARRFGGYPEQVAFEPLNEVVPQDVAGEWNDLLRRYINRVRAIAPDTYLVLGGVCYNSVVSVPLLDVPVDAHTVYNFHCYEPIIFTHQGAYWVEDMPQDFRIDYPKTLEEYRAQSRSLSSELAGAIFEDWAGEIGETFFESIFEPAIKKAQEDNAALYCGEYGVIDLADDQASLRWLKDIHRAFDKYSIGHALWNYKQKDFGLVDPQTEGRRKGIIDLL